MRSSRGSAPCFRVYRGGPRRPRRWQRRRQRHSSSSLSRTPWNPGARTSPSAGSRRPFGGGGLERGAARLARVKSARRPGPARRGATNDLDSDHDQDERALRINGVLETHTQREREREITRMLSLARWVWIGFCCDSHESNLLAGSTPRAAAPSTNSTPATNKTRERRESTAS